MKKIVFSLLAMATITMSCGQTSGEVKSAKDSTAYAIGVFIGNSVQRGTIAEVNYSQIKKAVEDVYNGNKDNIQDAYTYLNSAEIAQQAFYGVDSTLDCNLILLGAKETLDNDSTSVSFENANEIIMSYIDSKNLKKSEEYLAKVDAEKKDSLKMTEDGIRYIIYNQGEGVIEDSSKVNVHYTLYDYNDNVIDSSIQRGEPLEAQLPNGVVKGFAEAIQLVGIGGKLTVWIPGELGYGKQGAGERIGPNQVLKFDIEVVSVVE